MIKKLLIQNVGMADVMPRMQLEVILGDEEELLEPTTSSVDAYQARKYMDRCSHDDRHSLEIREREKGQYQVNCGYCNYSLDLRKAEERLSKVFECNMSKREIDHHL